MEAAQSKIKGAQNTFQTTAAESPERGRDRHAKEPLTTSNMKTISNNNKRRTNMTEPCRVGEKQPHEGVKDSWLTSRRSLGPPTASMC